MSVAVCQSNFIYKNRHQGPDLSPVHKSPIPGFELLGAPVKCNRKTCRLVRGSQEGRLDAGDVLKEIVEKEMKLCQLVLQNTKKCYRLLLCSSILCYHCLISRRLYLEAVLILFLHHNKLQGKSASLQSLVILLKVTGQTMFSENHNLAIQLCIIKSFSKRKNMTQSKQLTYWDFFFLF